MLSAILTLIMASFHVYNMYTFGEEDISQYVLTDSHDFGRFLFDTEQNKAGSLLFLSLTLLTVPNIHPVIRRKFFELFYYTHIALAFLVIGFALWHGLSILFIGAAWWVLDGLIRYVIMARFRYRTQATLRNLEGNIVEITFPKPANFDYMAGQYVMICIPKISVFQFHPFSISTSPHQDTVSFHVRSLGNWTKALADLADKQRQVKILIEGPYGNLSVDLENESKYKMVLLISGGIGITPLQSICNSLIHQCEHQGREMKKLFFLWVVREEESIGAMTDSSSTHLPGKEKHVKLDGFMPDLLIRKNAGEEVDEEGIEASISKMENDFMGHDFLHTEYYLTSMKKPQEGEKEKSIALTSHVISGRPDLDKVFGDMKDMAVNNGEKRIAVCVCGPTKLVDDVKASCRKYSSGEFKCGGVQFDVHEESFEF